MDSNKLSYMLLVMFIMHFFLTYFFHSFERSEHKLFRFHKIKERSILYAHRKRALTFMMWDTLAAIITTAILFAIPPIALYDGKH